MPLPLIIWAAIALAILLISGGTSNAIMQLPEATVKPVAQYSGGAIGYAIALGVIILASVYALKIWRK